MVSIEARRCQPFAVGGHAGEMRGGASHSQWAGMWERGEVAAVIHSGWLQGQRRGREERGVAIDVGERRGGMKQNNYQPVR